MIGKRHGGIDITNNRIGQAFRIDFAPRNGFAWCRSRETAGIGSRVGHLQEIVVPAFIDPERVVFGVIGAGSILSPRKNLLVRFAIAFRLLQVA